jgi:hypothetical protein
MGITAFIEPLEIHTAEDAKRMRFLGSPTIRVDGLDVETAAREVRHFAIGCRTYVVNGVRLGLPPQEWIENAIRETVVRGRCIL